MVEYLEYKTIVLLDQRHELVHFPLVLKSLQNRHIFVYDKKLVIEK